MRSLGLHLLALLDSYHQNLPVRMRSHVAAVITRPLPQGTEPFTEEVRLVRICLCENTRNGAKEIGYTNVLFRLKDRPLGLYEGLSHLVFVASMRTSDD